MLLVYMCSNAFVSIVQCAKQPLGSKACGLYTCLNLRESKKYTNSWKKLKEAVKNHGETMKNERQAYLLVHPREMRARRRTILRQ